MPRRAGEELGVRPRGLEQAASLRISNSHIRILSANAAGSFSHNSPVAKRQPLSPQRLAGLPFCFLSPKRRFFRFRAQKSRVVPPPASLYSLLRRADSPRFLVRIPHSEFRICKAVPPLEGPIMAKTNFFDSEKRSTESGPKVIPRPAFRSPLFAFPAPVGRCTIPRPASAATR